MSLQKEIISQVEDIIKPIIEQEEVELVDISYQRESTGWVLRVIIDKPEGVRVDDCSSISRQISDSLDVHNVIDGLFNLEVTSPGINRPLIKESDFIRFKGSVVSVKTWAEIENRKKFKGVLTDFRDGIVVLDVEKKNYSIPLKKIKKANLELTI